MVSQVGATSQFRGFESVIQQTEEILNLVRNNRLRLKDVPIQFRDFPNIVEAAVINDPRQILDVRLPKENLGPYIPILIRALDKDPELFKSLHPKIQSRPELRKYGPVPQARVIELILAPKDPQIQHFMGRYSAPQCASPNCQMDPRKAQVINSIKGGTSLSEFPEYQDDPDVVNEAVMRDGLELRHAGPKCRANCAIVLHAVTNNPDAFQYATGDVLDDFVIAGTAVERSPPMLEFAGPRRKDDWRLVLWACRKNPSVLRFASEDLQKLGLAGLEDRALD